MSPGKQMPADREGYYYSTDLAEIVQAEAGEMLPEAQHWEYLGSVEDMTPADAVAELESRYPDVSVELTFKHL